MSQKKSNVHLLVIDPQVDFCDPAVGSLYVPGAEHDIVRLAAMLGTSGNRIGDVHVTLDSHQDLHIAHPEFVVDTKGNHPKPFTAITLAKAKAGEYSAANPATQAYWMWYIEQLETNGRYPYLIWPPHCRIGTTGATVMPAFGAALRDWCLRRFAVIDWVPKGSSWKTEHYSGVQADVPDAADPTTQINTRLIQTLEEADVILLAGEAGSHCLANTVTDIANGFSDPGYIAKFVLLTDGTSLIPGFEGKYNDFVTDLRSRGMQTATVAEALRNV